MTDPNTSPAEARQADADFGLFGGPTTAPDDEPAEPGAQPADVYDPTFFQV